MAVGGFDAKTGDRGVTQKIATRFQYSYDAEIQGRGDRYKFDDFDGLFDENRYESDEYGSGAASSIALNKTLAGGVLTFTTHTDAGDGYQIQMLDNIVIPTADKQFAMEARVKIDTATADFFIGFASDDASILGATDVTCDDYIGLWCSAGDVKADTNTAGGTAKTGSETILDLVVDTWYQFGVVIDGWGTPHFYLDGDEVAHGLAASDAYLDATPLLPTVAFGSPGSAAVMDLDWIASWQEQVSEANA